MKLASGQRVQVKSTKSTLKTSIVFLDYMYLVTEVSNIYSYSSKVHHGTVELCLESAFPNVQAWIFAWKRPFQVFTQFHAHLVFHAHSVQICHVPDLVVHMDV